jgi:hypothetical protein
MICINKLPAKVRVFTSYVIKSRLKSEDYFDIPGGSLCLVKQLRS